MSTALEVNDSANALFDAGRLEEALAGYRRAIDLDPRLGAAHYNLGNCCQALGRMEEAVSSYRLALELWPRYAPAFNNLGNTLHRLGRSGQARRCYLAALQIQPSYPEAAFGLGNLALEKGQVDEAAERYRQALQDRPDFAQAHFNLSLALMLAGDYVAGWAEYEWRWRCAEAVGLTPRDFEEPHWEGEGAAGKTMLVHAEQGFGDTIQFVRYLTALRPLVGRLVLECPPELMRLLSELPCSDQIVPAGNPLPPFDVHAPLLSLPYLLAQPHYNPPCWPYLLPDPALVAHWAQRLPSEGELKVGLVWAGRPQNAKDARRSLPLAALAPLTRLSGIRLFALQKGNAESELRELSTETSVENLAPLLVDFADTAAALTRLDLLISVDTAVAHLGAALGRPVWLLLSEVPNWRWGLAGESTAWYPTMRLFRRDRGGGWPDVIARVVDQLCRRTNTQPVMGRKSIAAHGQSK